jgi:hypothetical protein
VGRTHLLAILLLASTSLSLVTAHAQERGRGGPPLTPQTLAPANLTGQWVAVISEDWRWRMITPAKGDYASIPLTPEGLKVADTWDPARDEAAGEQCRSYGAPGLMRSPTRLRTSWLDANTLKVESDYGMQTRLLHFGNWTPPAGAPTWQGDTTAQWMGRGRGPGAGSTIKSVTTRLKPGYLRKNGVPYGARTVLTEYWDVVTETNGDEWLVVTNVVEDPVHLQMPWTTAMHFKKERETSTWDPTPCSARW